MLFSFLPHYHFKCFFARYILVFCCIDATQFCNILATLVVVEMEYFGTILIMGGDEKVCLRDKIDQSSPIDFPLARGSRKEPI